MERSLHRPSCCASRVPGLCPNPADRAPCPICDGRGFLKTAETVCYEIFREILRVNRAYEAENYLVMASQKVVDRLLDEESDNVADLETFISQILFNIIVSPPVIHFTNFISTDAEPAGTLQSYSVTTKFRRILPQNVEPSFISSKCFTTAPGLSSRLF